MEQTLRHDCGTLTVEPALQVVALHSQSMLVCKKNFLAGSRFGTGCCDELLDTSAQRHCLNFQTTSRSGPSWDGRVGIDARPSHSPFKVTARSQVISPQLEFRGCFFQTSLVPHITRKSFAVHHAIDLSLTSELVLIFLAHNMLSADHRQIGAEYNADDISDSCIGGTGGETRLFSQDQPLVPDYAAHSLQGLDCRGRGLSVDQ